MTNAARLYNLIDGKRTRPQLQALMGLGKRRFEDAVTELRRAGKILTVQTGKVFRYERIMPLDAQNQRV